MISRSVLSASVPPPSKNEMPARRVARPSIPIRDVALEAEGGVVESVLQHLRVAGTNHVGIAAVRHEREAVSFEREVPLMRLHGGDDDVARQVEEALVEGAFQHRRPLRQVHHLVEDSRGVAPPLRQPLEDQPAPLGGSGFDARGPQALGVVLGRGNLDGIGDEAVAERVGSRERLLVELGQHPADGARIPEPAVVPAHRLGEGEALDDGIDPLREHLAQGPAGQLDPEEAVTHLQVVRTRRRDGERTRRPRARASPPGAP